MRTTRRTKILPEIKEITLSIGTLRHYQNDLVWAHCACSSSVSTIKYIMLILIPLCFLTNIGLWRLTVPLSVRVHFDPRLSIKIKCSLIKHWKDLNLVYNQTKKNENTLRVFKTRKSESLFNIFYLQLWLLNGVIMGWVIFKTQVLSLYR